MMKSNHYEASVRESVLAQILKHQVPLGQVAEANGIPYNTVWNWVRKAAKAATIANAMSDKRTSEFTPEERFRILMETSRLSSEELGVYLREKGLFEATLREWQRQALGGLTDRPVVRNRSEEKRIQKLERELARKDKALAEAGALLLLRKKVEALLEDEELDGSKSAAPKSSR